MAATRAIVLYGRIDSGNVQKVLWTLDELNIKYDRVDAGKKFDLNKSNPNYT